MTLSNGYRTVDLAGIAITYRSPKLWFKSVLFYLQALIALCPDKDATFFFWPALSLHNENSKVHEIPRLFQYASENLIAISNKHETWYDRYAIRVHPTTLTLRLPD